MKSDLSKVKVGDSIWTIQKGNVKVIRIDNDGYPVVTESISYSKDGKVWTSDQYPSAFLTNPFIDEEFIKEAYSDACPKWQTKLKEKFPEVFKSELEVGKWYKWHTDGSILLYISNFDKDKIKGFGLENKDWFDNRNDETYWGYKTDTCWTLATEAEVKEALINEFELKMKKANSRNIKSLDGKIMNDIGIYHTFDFKENKLYGNGGGTGIYFNNGTWAEIIPKVTELTLEQIADKFGVDVNTLKIKK